MPIIATIYMLLLECEQNYSIKILKKKVNKFSYIFDFILLYCINV